MKNSTHKKIEKGMTSMVSWGMGIIVILGVVLFGVSALPAFAQQPAGGTTNYILLAPLPYVAGGSSQNNPSGTCPTGTSNDPNAVCTNFVQYLLGIFKLVIALSAVLAVVMITYGGLEYIMSSSFGAKQDGKERITNAVIGLLLALASYLILYTINPNLVTLNFSVPATLPTTSTTGGNATAPSTANTSTGCFTGGGGQGGGGAGGSYTTPSTCTLPNSSSGTGASSGTSASSGSSNTSNTSNISNCDDPNSDCSD